MAAIAGWTSLLNVSLEQTWGTAVTGAWCIPLLNSVSIGPIAPTYISAGHVRDSKSNIQERYTGSGNLAAAFSGAQTPLTPRVMQWLFANFTQAPTGNANEATDYVLPLDYSGAQCLGYSDGTFPGCPYTIDKVMGGVNTTSQRMTGGVISKIGIDCPQLGQGVVTFDAIGKAELTAAAVNAAPTLITDSVLCTKDMTLEWNTSALPVLSANIEFTNSAFPVWTKATAPIAILRGPTKITASIVVDWGLYGQTWDTFIRAGTVNQFEMIWGTPGSDGHFQVDIDAKVIPTPSQVEADSIERLTINFEGMIGTSTASTYDITTNTATIFNFAT